MRKIIGLFAVAAALLLAGIAGWIASSTHARVNAATDLRVDPMQIMAQARGLPTEQFVDLSVTFE
jgi:hypothetical protein